MGGMRGSFSEWRQSFIGTGHALHYAELSNVRGVDVEEGRWLQWEAIAAGVGCWFVDGTDYFESFAPFYNTPRSLSDMVAHETNKGAGSP